MSFSEEATVKEDQTSKLQGDEEGEQRGVVSEPAQFKEPAEEPMIGADSQIPVEHRGLVPDNVQALFKLNPESEIGRDAEPPHVAPQQSTSVHPRDEEQAVRLHKHRVLLVLVDGSESADSAFECALRFKKPDEVLHICHAAETLTSWSPGARNMRYVSRYHFDDVNNAIKKLGREIVQAYGREAFRVLGKEHAHPTLRHEVVVSFKSTPKEAALDFVCLNRVDDVFVGCRGLSPVKEQSLGSFSKFLIDHCPHNVTIHLSR